MIGVLIGIVLVLTVLLAVEFRNWGGYTGEWMLFLDDVRSVSDVWDYDSSDDWVVVRSVDEAKSAILSHAEFPDFISFDHDLGDNNTGMDFVKLLIEYDYSNCAILPTFRYHVHSMNPVGAENIIGMLDGYLNQKYPFNKNGWLE